MQVQSYLAEVERSNGFYLFRWGDAPVHTMVSQHGWHMRHDTCVNHDHDVPTQASSYQTQGQSLIVYAVQSQAMLSKVRHQPTR